MALLSPWLWGLSVPDRGICSEESCAILAMTLSSVTWSFYEKVLHTLLLLPLLPAHIHIKVASKTRELCIHALLSPVSSWESTSLVFSYYLKSLLPAGSEVFKWRDSWSYSLLIHSVCISRLPKSIKTLWGARLKNSTVSNNPFFEKKAENKSLQKSTEIVEGHSKWRSWTICHGLTPPSSERIMSSHSCTEGKTTELLCCFSASVLPSFPGALQPRCNE